MTRKEAHRLARITWGQRAKAMAQVAEHIITNHPGRTK